LAKPGRDPRPDFKVASFKEGVETIDDLQEDMILEGVISNVANFGAFVDIGVHQDGLVHVSEIADRYVTDIHSEVKVGQIVRVKVLEVDKARKRISLTMKLGGKSGGKSAKPDTPSKRPVKAKQKSAPDKPQSALADQLKQMFKQ